MSMAEQTGARHVATLTSRTLRLLRAVAELLGRAPSGVIFDARRFPCGDEIDALDAAQRRTLEHLTWALSDPQSGWMRELAFVLTAEARAWNELPSGESYADELFTMSGRLFAEYQRIGRAVV